ncbi:phage tail tube protein [Oceanobacillus sojae]|uniref:Putative major tail shaft protein, phage associated n=1 Tax=Oceanobacillus sojae TaxID=582851 RepID=A0A511ZIH9_9BACI|nr:phage tail protein [Oceanobacillus sojae]GEN87252.1 putative major tail shaft protein, phage associated [Oceanobacillus sojae]
MARLKNALRGHFIQKYEQGQNQPTSDDWLELADYISDISDDTNEETEDIAYYSGDGTPETEVTSVAWGYSVEGTYDSSNPAMKLVESMRLKTGNDRKVWHRVVAADGSKEYVGRATVYGIVAGSGAAGEHEAFNCIIRYDRIPEENILDDDNGNGGEPGE